MRVLQGMGAPLDSIGTGHDYHEPFIALDTTTTGYGGPPGQPMAVSLMVATWLQDCDLAYRPYVQQGQHSVEYGGLDTTTMDTTTMDNIVLSTADFGT